MRFIFVEPKWTNAVVRILLFLSYQDVFGLLGHTSLDHAGVRDFRKSMRLEIATDRGKQSNMVACLCVLRPRYRTIKRCSDNKGISFMISRFPGPMHAHQVYGSRGLQLEHDF